MAKKKVKCIYTGGGYYGTFLEYGETYEAEQGKDEHRYYIYSKYGYIGQFNKTRFIDV
ncbi:MULTISPECIES: hypothetical protein [unclassified Clostridium]|uniref:hypothetical protein n=1 Tax=unclassified Clostridium TaxID=2614128 RepID=UPI0025C1E198|nr:MULTISPECIES: hypothetical protein [unclassified Clostridium]